MSTVSEWMQRRAELDAHVRDAPSLASDARERTERVRTKFLDECRERFGRSPSLQRFDQGAALAPWFVEWEQLESEYVRMASSSTPAAEKNAAFERFAQSFLAWANRATQGWQDREAYERQQGAREQARFASPYFNR